MKTNERLQSLRVLTRLFEEKTHLTHALAEVKLSPLGQEICFGVCRYYFQLHEIADQLISKKPKSIDVWLCLLMGLYELHYLRTPDYAVVRETVELLVACKKMWAKGFVNASLRTYCREKDTLSERVSSNESYQLNHPEWFVTQIQADWPADWQQVLAANDKRPPMTLRVNQAHTKRDAYLQALDKGGIEAEPMVQGPCAIELKTPCDVYDLPGFAKGDVSVQDLAAQFAAFLLDLKPGLHVLDACAAPGGKTCHILESETNLRECVALDNDSHRLKRVEENLKRLQLQATVVTGDALTPNAWWDGQLFDRILLDAPCSATGVIRRHPDIKILRQARDINPLCLTQQGLLESLWPLLTPGGILVYATCSVLRAENEEQISHFLKTHPSAESLTDRFPEWARVSDYGWQILPGDTNADGFFYSVLKKRT